LFPNRLATMIMEVLVFMINFITILLIQICLTLWGGLILYYKSKQSEQKFIQKIAELERNLELSKSDNGGTFY
jgi:5-bromo-4-chloroindolyl phosphate hydrolysis protein